MNKQTLLCQKLYPYDNLTYLLLQISCLTKLCRVGHWEHIWSQYTTSHWNIAIFRHFLSISRGSWMDDWINKSVHESVTWSTNSCERTKVRICQPRCEAQGRDNDCCLGTQHMLEHKCVCQCLIQLWSRLKKRGWKRSVHEICFEGKTLSDVILIFLGGIKYKIYARRLQRRS